LQALALWSFPTENRVSQKSIANFVSQFHQAGFRSTFPSPLQHLLLNLVRASVKISGYVAISQESEGHCLR
jgi:hypothetical protein